MTRLPDRFAIACAIGGLFGAADALAQTSIDAADLGYYRHVTDPNGGATITSNHWAVDENAVPVVHQSYLTGLARFGSFADTR